MSLRKGSKVMSNSTTKEVELGRVERDPWRRPENGWRKQ